MKPLKVLFSLVGIFCLIFVAYAIFYDEIRRTIYPIRYEAEILAVAEEYGISPAKLHAVIKTESDYDPKAVSRVGARGLMQLIGETATDTAKSFGEEFDEATDLEKLFDVELNLRYGSAYLAKLYRIYGDWDVAHAAYNAGPGNVNKWLTNPKYSSDGETLDSVPFGETEKYLEKIAKYEKIYEELYFSEAREDRIDAAKQN